MGLQGAIARFLPRSIWHNQTYSSAKMQEWLSILGFQLTQKEFGYHRLSGKRKKPRNSWRRLVARLFHQLTKQLPLGSFYCITAVKQEAAMTPDAVKWRAATAGFSALSPKANIRHGKVVPFKKS